MSSFDPHGSGEAVICKVKSLFLSGENLLCTKATKCVYAYVGLFIFHTSLWEKLKARRRLASGLTCLDINIEYLQWLHGTERRYHQMTAQLFA